MPGGRRDRSAGRTWTRSRHTVRRHGIRLRDFERTGELDVDTNPGTYLTWDHAAPPAGSRCPGRARGAPGMRTPMSAGRSRLAALLTAGLGPRRTARWWDTARLAWGLSRACLEAGVRSTSRPGPRPSERGPGLRFLPPRQRAHAARRAGTALRPAAEPPFCAGTWVGAGLTTTGHDGGNREKKAPLVSGPAGAANRLPPPPAASAKWANSP